MKGVTAHNVEQVNMSDRQHTIHQLECQSKTQVTGKSDQGCRCRRQKATMRKLGLTKAMALSAELLGGERIARVWFSWPILKASICQGLASEDISIHKVEGAAVEADIVPNHEVPRCKKAAI